ncbi:hypothetical protein P691DRAFT_784904, partial [Macrolepiota fuliginosa MF-IS2]
TRSASLDSDRIRVTRTEEIVRPCGAIRTSRGLVKGIEQLAKYGLLFVTGVPNKETSDEKCELRRLAERFGEIRPTLYGCLWDVLHASDLINSFFLGQELRDYIIRFTVKLDPSGTGLLDLEWPKYTTGNPSQLVFLDGLIPPVIGKDAYRQPQMDFLTQLTLQVPV